MSEATQQHRAASPTSVRCVVCTVSDTRTLDTDTGGALLTELLTAAGHDVVERVIVPDEPVQMTPLLIRWRDRPEVQAVLMTGGTGISHRDQTFETVQSLLSKTLPGYGELFRMLSYQEIGPAAILSRAVGGMMGRTILLTMPGSRAAVRLAMESIVIPELPHLVREATK